VFNATVVTIANATASFMFGIIMFMFIGFLARKEGKAVSEISSGGFGLVFTTMPMVLKYTPPGLANILGMIFFLMITVLGLSSSISLLQTLIIFLGDLYPEIMTKHRKKVIVSVVVFQYFVGLIFVCEAGYSFIDIVDTFLANYQTIITGIFETVVVCYVMRGGVEKVYELVSANSETGPMWKRLHPFLVHSTKYVIPSALSWMMIENLVKDAKGEGIAGRYPTWGVVVFGYVIILGLVTAAPILYGILVPIDTSAFMDDTDDSIILKPAGSKPKIDGGAATAAGVEL